MRALDGVDMVLPRGKTVAVVGRSGSGKTTLAMCLALLEQPDAGDIIFEGHRIDNLGRAARRTLRQQIQIILQHSTEALSPRLSVTQLVEEPLRIQRRLPHQQRSNLVKRLLGQVGLGPELYARLPHELSGGQRQRVAIARSLALNPTVLILDEPFVGLDPPIRNQIATLLLKLQRIYRLTFLYISHDMELVSYFADAMLTMQQGKVLASEDARRCSR